MASRPSRRWKYLPAYLAHGVIGAWCGYHLNDRPASSLTATGLYLVYQTLEMWRLGDTPSRDVSDFGIGWAAGLALRRWREKKDAEG